MGLEREKARSSPDTVDPSVWEKVIAYLETLPLSDDVDPDDVDPFV